MSTYRVVPFQGSIAGFHVTVNRDIKKFIASEKCALKDNLEFDIERRDAVANAPRKYCFIVTRPVGFF